MNTLLVRSANDAFRKGDYVKAHQFYKLASKKYGERLFNINILLCEKYIKKESKFPHGTKNKTGITSSNKEAISPGIIKKTKKEENNLLKALYILDPISETNWSKQFNLTSLRINNYAEQIESLDYDFVFLESCWNGNNGDWQYAFVSPDFQHQNSKKLLDAIDRIKKKGKPILFWNKEDPMHFEKYLPIAKLCDIVFTTDSNLIPSYKDLLGHDAIYSLPFGADPHLCNPSERFRTPPESVCFAGAYYPEKHDERVRQMNYVLPATLKYSGAIYDRYSSLETDKYRFPKKYSDVVRNSVPFHEIVKIYKLFSVFLNVNTIVNSPTMMSRRVYELLASGTPVVSAPSLAIKNQFNDIVMTGESEYEINNHVSKLLNDQEYWEKKSHRGYREVMTKHTYTQNREIIMEAVLGELYSKPADPLISVIIASCRPKNIGRMIENISRQRHSNFEVIFALTKNFSEKDIGELKTLKKLNPNIRRLEFLTFGNEVSLGRCLNEAIKKSCGEYIAKCDDDNYYFENYLIDLAIPFTFGDYAVVGKESYFCYLGGKNLTILRYPEKRHRDTDFVAGDAMMIKREVFQTTGFPEKRVGEDTKLLKDISALGGRIYTTDHFNFIKYRDADLTTQTWIIEEEDLMRQSKVVSEGLREDFAKC